ncbi:MAG: DUF3460 family protein [Burkholderiales bacterium]|jgi:hypothetical protein|nr:DUF3460 family protein [Burkholderiales bacterium]
MKNTKYVSEATTFINGLLNKPGNHEQQMKLRSTWWDTAFRDQDEVKHAAESEVKHDGYVYFSYKQNK